MSDSTFGKHMFGKNTALPKYNLLPWPSAFVINNIQSPGKHHIFLALKQKTVTYKCYESLWVVLLFLFGRESQELLENVGDVLNCGRVEVKEKTN